MCSALGSVALDQSSSVISLKNNVFLKRQLYHLVKNQKNASYFRGNMKFSFYVIFGLQ
jgi:hypothetical protein